MGDASNKLASPPVVAAAGWVVPGAGYLLLGQTVRGVTVGATIIGLFLAGLLIAGVQVIEVPGYRPEDGSPTMVQMVYTRTGIDGQPHDVRVNDWILTAAPMSEIKNKLWAIPQAMTGPIAIGAAVISLQVARHDAAHPANKVGKRSQARLSDIGALYCSVAGVLNLMAVIDSAWRANRGQGSRA